MPLLAAHMTGESRDTSDHPVRGESLGRGLELSVRLGERSGSADRPRRRGRQGELPESLLSQLDRLHRLARRILRSEDLAEDAVQEALISLWRVGQLPPNLTAWLARAVVHRSLHLSRCRKRRRTHEQRAGSARTEAERGKDPSQALESKELGFLIEEALSRLPDQFREVFVLREMERMDYASIAGQLRVPVGTVRSRLARSREALQKILGNLNGSDCDGERHEPVRSGRRRSGRDGFPVMSGTPEQATALSR